MTANKNRQTGEGCARSKDAHMSGVSHRHLHEIYEERKRELEAMNLPYPKHERRRRQIEQETGV